MGHWRSTHVAEPLVKLSVSITRELRTALDEARENSEERASIYRAHTLSSEVEELLRIGLKMRSSGNFLTLQMDDGIWAWLYAYSKGPGFYGSMEDTAIAAIRNFIIDATKHKHIEERCMPYLKP